jgi:hypothetical protein
MTGKCGAGAPARVGRQISQFPNKTKKATPLAQRGLWFYAGDDLISHTLSRAVPSALRGKSQPADQRPNHSSFLLTLSIKLL